MDIGKTLGLPEGKATRVAFGETLAELGAQDNDLVVVDADLNNSTRTDFFLKQFPDRFFNMGICESNMVGVAGGLAAAGKKPWISSFATFMLCNAMDQLRLSVAFPKLNVKVVGSHSGISIGADGPSQMGIEDLALAGAFPAHHGDDDAIWSGGCSFGGAHPSARKALGAISRGGIGRHRDTTTPAGPARRPRWCGNSFRTCSARRPERRFQRTDHPG